MKYTVLVLWYLVYRVNCDDGYEFVRPTPVSNMPSKIQSTDQLNPLKVNVQSQPKVLTTGAGVLLNPTPINKPIQTTGIANPSAIDVLVKSQSATTFITAPIDNLLVNPTPVLNELPTLNTWAGNPIITNNVPVTPPLITTGVVGNGAVKPTPVILTLGTKPVAIGLTNDDEPVPPVLPSTGTVAWNFIKPSQVSENSGGSATGVHTSEYEEAPIQVLSSQLVNDPQSIPPCTCEYLEQPPTPALGLASYDMENALTPQFLTPDGSNPDDQDVARPPNDFRPLIVSLQLNLYINNIPVLAANAIPLYF